MSVIVITAGEPAGIGPDCIIRAFLDSPADFDGCIIAAPAHWLQQRADQIQARVLIREFENLTEATAAAALTPRDSLYCWNPISSQTAGVVLAGQPSEHTAAEVVGCIEAAAKACLRNEAAALVTGPIEKAVLRRTGFKFPGHTEFLDYLAMNAEPECDGQSNFVMMLASDEIRVALLTTHMALRDVPDALSVAETLKCMRIVDRDLRKKFGIDHPKLALCGLNPHAGEQGHFGREEIEILAPAAQQARAEGIDVTDPMPADTIFSKAVRLHYDAMICCYHDQALIPLKALSFGESVNVTLGLPFIRTSVDHGTALDRVGADDVSCSSLLAAIRMATQMCDTKVNV